MSHVFRTFRSFRRLIAASLVGAAASASAAIVVDTGTPDPPGANGGAALYNDAAGYQFLAGRFTLEQGGTIDRIDGYMALFRSGGLQLALYPEAGLGVLPPLASKVFDMEASYPTLWADWRAFSGLDWTVGAGTYWIAFLAMPSFSGAMPSGAPEPLDSYANSQSTRPSPWPVQGSWSTTSGIESLGVRVHASLVPEAPIWALLAGGGLLVAAARARRPPIAASV